MGVCYDWDNAGNWFSHPTASLLVSDFNGDGRSDLLCHTRANGSLDVKLARAGDVKVIWLIAGFTVVTLRIVAPVAAQDFNGDGFKDLAIGAAWEDVGPKAGAGAVIVIYGAGTGLTAVGGVIASQMFDQSSPNVPGAPNDFERFGESLTWGRFNDDQYDDLAIGVPKEADDIGEDLTMAGAVIVIYGSAGGLNPAGAGGAPPAQFWHQNVPGVFDACEIGDLFGTTLSAGDYNGDGYDDLAVGATGEHLDDVNYTDQDAGVVHIIPGSAAGLTAAGSIQWSQAWIGGGTVSEEGDHFGGTLATGNFNGDLFDDLAIGAPEEDLSDVVTTSGEVDVLYGHPAGLGAGGNAQIWTESSPLIGTGAQSNNRFGAAIAAGDFDGDGDDDVAFGAPGRAVGGNAVAGVVHTLKSNAASGIGGQGGVGETWSFSTAGIPGDAGAGEQFGEALASGDFNGDLKDDLAIGSPRDSVGAIAFTGTIVAIYGSPAGLKARLNNGAVIAAQMWHQNKRDVPGACAAGDFFGWPLVAADFDKDSIDDLAIGVQFDVVAGLSAGAVNVIYGAPTPTGLSANAAPVNAQIWHQNRPGVPDAAAADERFGAAFARQ